MTILAWFFIWLDHFEATITARQTFIEDASFKLLTFVLGQTVQKDAK